LGIDDRHRVVAAQRHVGARAIGGEADPDGNRVAGERNTAHLAGVAQGVHWGDRDLVARAAPRSPSARALAGPEFARARAEEAQAERGAPGKTRCHRRV
jgi:hypothetical protein